MLMEKTKDDQTRAFEFDDQTLQDQNPVIRTQSLLTKHYYILYKQ